MGLLYQGTGRTNGGRVLPMTKADAYFWANREKREQERLARIAERKSNVQGK